MSKSSLVRRYVVCNLQWLIDTPTKVAEVGLTCYRKEIGVDDLFSIYVRFTSTEKGSGHWSQAKVFALAEEMSSRLPKVGKTLIITSGFNPIAIATITSEGEETIE